MVSLDNDIAGVEWIDASAEDSPWGGATVQDSLIVGHSKLREIGAFKLGHVDQRNCTTHGIWLPKTSRLTVSNVDFVNFDEDGCTAFGTCAHCKPDDGASFIRTNKLRLSASPNLVAFEHVHASIIEDQDGSLTGTAGGSLVPKMKFLDPAICTDLPGASHGPYPGTKCTRGRFAKVAFNQVLPNSISEKTAFFNNSLGSDPVWFREKAISHKNGYATFIPVNTRDPVDISFDRSEHLTNISYSMTISEMQPNEYAYLQHTFMQDPDSFSTGNGKMNGTEAIPDPTSGKHGDWYYNQPQQKMTYLVKGTGNATQPQDKPISYRVYRCFFDKCVAPTAPPIPDGRPETFKMWSKDSDWTSGAKPVASGNATIEADWYMVQDVASPIHLDQLYIFGVLELEPSIEHTLKAKMIFISGTLCLWILNSLKHSNLLKLLTNAYILNFPRL